MTGGMGSPLKLKVLLVEKRRTWEKNGRQGAIYQLYGQLFNERPEFPLYLVVSAPLTMSIVPNTVLDVPISGINISLGDPLSASSGFDFDVPFDVVKDKEKK
ncbi:hypothetical protein [Hydrogenobacter hydrogenophilus]|uniref:Uncharacterized protein n=1 Tax=Hydrogenobacter hydrogenophilus TaxID=35835 RepID=A0A285P6G8_9AQUI|nr:hypothetical protein [Hydrogenobacter hydrogenophilus]SNZ16753.1 hypothetical protein SAMN06265353_1698 [Hydrogenobacter hydrogenophilus]